jgi:hypothetical protein
MATQTLIPKSSKIPALYAQDGKGDKARVHIKLFTPCGGWTWLLTEYDPKDGVAFGYAYNSQDPDCAELGYISVTELAALKNRQLGGIPMVERDIHFQPKTLVEAKRIECPNA